jgi:HTH-type transcriptional regulator/antitoxin HigA
MEEVKKFAEAVQPYWAVMAPVLTMRTEADYDGAVSRLNALLDEAGDDTTHPLYGLLDTLGHADPRYEDDHIAMPKATGVDALHYLMEEHDLTQSDFPEIGSQGVVSEILHGKRRLNLRQIQALTERFHVSPAAFI